jgi:hypothetical protein
MAARRNAERWLVDAWTANLGGPRTAAISDRQDKAVAWETLVRPIAALPEYRWRYDDDFARHITPSHAIHPAATIDQ